MAELITRRMAILITTPISEPCQLRSAQPSSYAKAIKRPCDTKERPIAEGLKHCYNSSMTKLTPEHCAARRHRLLAEMQSKRLDAAVITDVRDIYYFTGCLLPADLPAVWTLRSDGRHALVGPEHHLAAGVEHRVTYAWNLQGTRHTSPLAHMVEAAREGWQGVGIKRAGCQRQSILDEVRSALADESGCEFEGLDESIAVMQRVKDPDEIEVIRASIQANLGAYDAARQAICPGVTELEVLAAGIQGATVTVGEKVFHDGDYQCGVLNGPARNRPCQLGELYIIDAWTCFRGYWADMSRTFIVGCEPTDVQRALYDHLRWVHGEVENLLRPGVDGKEVFTALDEMIRQHPPLAENGLVHHGGHGTGIRSQEMPDINRDRGGRFETGNVICVEPGGYHDEARYGVRLENVYLITDDGCEDLCPGEVELLRCG